MNVNVERAALAGERAEAYRDRAEQLLHQGDMGGIAFALLVIDARLEQQAWLLRDIAENG